MKIGQIMIEVYFDPETGIHLTTSPEEVQQGTHTGNVEKSNNVSGRGPTGPRLGHLRRG